MAFWIMSAILFTASSIVRTHQPIILLVFRPLPTVPFGDRKTIDERRAPLAVGAAESGMAHTLYHGADYLPDCAEEARIR